MNATEKATLVDSTGPYVTRGGGLDWVGKIDADSINYPAQSRDEWNTWTCEGRFIASERSPHPYDLVAKADVSTLIAACVRNLLRLHEETDPSAERVAFLAEGLAKEYEARLGEWDDLVEAGATTAEKAESGDLITGPGRYPQRSGRVAAVTKPDRSYASHGCWEGHDEDHTRCWRPDGFWGAHGVDKSPQPHDIIGPRIPDHLSDEQAARHARLVAENLRRKEAGEPCGCESPIEPTVTVEPAPAPEPPKLEEEIGEGLWWAIDSRNGERCKVHVRRNALGDRWLMEGRIEHGDGTTHDFATPFDNEDEGESGYFFLIRRVKEPTTRPYTLEELEALVVRRAVLRGIRDSNLNRLATVIGSKLFDDGEPGVDIGGGGGIRVHTLPDYWTHIDGSPCCVTVAGDPWDAPPMQRTNVGNSPAGD